MSAEEARKSFAGFARITGLLVDSGPAPMVATTRSTLHRPTT
ncbi:hypothetical protein HNR59_003129 [Aquamicrobium lusatiense]|uniref:Uncharacterized protein n=2 Tax=Aquamicrobium lusatiense TaxID=89772 RepID=A0A7W9VWW2_9HYPH|nr:hypothetical protein [Aquamicrobium lusatiense]